MKITAAEVRTKLTSIWPDLENIWLHDPEFWLGNEKQIDRLMANSKLNDMEFITGFNECNHYTAQFMAEIHRIRYFSWKEGNLPDDQRLPYAIFFANGTQFRGISKVHTANLVLLKDEWTPTGPGGVWFVDMIPAERRKWKADPKQDNIYYVSKEV